MKLRMRAKLLIALLAMGLTAAGALPVAALEGCQFAVPVVVSWEGKDLPENTQAVLQLTAKQADAPLPAATELTVEAAKGVASGDKTVAKASFSDMQFTVVGDYQYHLKQKPSTVQHMVSDQTEYDLTIRVYYGTDGELAANVWAVNGQSDEKPQELSFANRYNKPEEPKPPQPDNPKPKPPTNPSTGEQDTRPIWIGIFAASAALIFLVLFGRRSRKEEQEA